ncbi:SMI1/KNR4 family protein [Pedobacter agri]|uniref:SMI1/KNR4 family protein n=1 Tax=Pedobacter agri TaxID=454586 RepID=UPI00292D117E|nr:SMI1/KNR4 family protein [Pedobacter agri]
MELKFFKDFDFIDFWKSQYSENEIITEELIASLELELGYKLPASYIELMKLHNGGSLKKNIPLIKFKSEQGTDWGLGTIEISDIMGIDRKNTYSIGGERGSRFWITEWEYPEIGIYFGCTPRGGHDMILMDYSVSGKQGEPQIVQIEPDGEKTILAKDFETFIRMLDNSNSYDY